MDSITTSEYSKTVEQRRAGTLARRVFDLEEPWRTRFITAIAGEAGNLSGNGNRAYAPTEMEVAQWLQDRTLSQQVSTMLNAWTQNK